MTNAKEAAEIDELKPCPFCGETAIDDEYEYDNNVIYEIKCTYCGGCFKSPTSLHRAIIGWNARVKEIESCDS